jgi:hypothetical protein
MSAQATHDLAIKNGEYTDQQGQTKGRWMKIGTVLKHDDGGTSIKLDCVPIGMPGWEGWVSVFPRNSQPAQQGQQRQQSQGGQPGGYGQPLPPQGQNGYASARQGGQMPPTANNYQDFDDEIPF